MGRAYIVVTALNYFEMQKLDEKLTLNVFPDNIAHVSKHTRRKYCDETSAKFIDKFLLQKVNDVFHDEEYFVKDYGLCVIFLLMLIMQMKDTAA